MTSLRLFTIERGEIAVGFNVEADGVNNNLTTASDMTLIFNLCLVSAFT